MKSFSLASLLLALLSLAHVSPALAEEARTEDARVGRDLVGVRPSDGCTIKQVIEPNTTAQGPGFRVARHGGDPLTLVDTDATMFSCVDARKEFPMVGAFAGDIGEFLTGADAYRRLCTGEAEKIDDAKIYKLLRDFVKAHTTPERPFYMHTDNSSLIRLLTDMNADSFPTTMTNETTKAKWFAKMFQGTTRYHGCGHLWYQMANPVQYDADIDLLYGVLKAFFELFWDPVYAKNMYYDLVLGNMDAHAVVVVEMDQPKPRLRGNEPNKCIDKVVPLRPRFCPKGCPANNVREFKKSLDYKQPFEYDVFTFHATAVERHRRKVLIPYFLSKCANKKVTAKTFYDRLVETANHWAESSLEHLHATPAEMPHLTLAVELQEQ